MQLFFAVLVMMILASCGPVARDVENTGKIPEIFPDYVDVTIPAGIAPLNFCVDGAQYVCAKASGSGNIIESATGKWASFDIADWKRITEACRGGGMEVEVTYMKDGKWYRGNPFKIFVSADSLNEFGLTYRKIAPGYETYSDLGIYQRDIHSFDEFAIISHTAIKGECMNCHVANRCNPGSFQLHIRGEHPATFVRSDGRDKYLITKTEATKANCAYAYWHPSGKYLAYSVDVVHQAFLEQGDRNIEVFDDVADAVVMDVDKNQLILSPTIMSGNYECYPVFSHDGKYIYYCSSKPPTSTARTDSMRYDLCRVTFNEENGCIGASADTVLRISHLGKSISHPRPSYDGRLMAFTVSDFSVFPIHHPESDIYMMDLSTGEYFALDGINSPLAESFQNWSTNSRWLVFCSRRDNGDNTLLYIAHINPDGHADKPFLLPQLNPREYYDNNMHSFNVPDFTTRKVDLDIRDFAANIFDDRRIRVEIKR